MLHRERQYILHLGYIHFVRCINDKQQDIFQTMRGRLKEIEASAYDIGKLLPRGAVISYMTVGRFLRITPSHAFVLQKARIVPSMHFLFLFFFFLNPPPLTTNEFVANGYPSCRIYCFPGRVSSFLSQMQTACLKCKLHPQCLFFLVE